MCAVVCPFAVITFYSLPDGPDPTIAVSVKCDGCIERQRRGEVPACVEVCKVDALVYGELNELLRASRLRQSAVALAEVTATDAARSGDALTPWRQWAEEVKDMSLTGGRK
jgi:Fe-S-cluster-containing dehydrogenase component